MTHYSIEAVTGNKGAGRRIKKGITAAAIMLGMLGSGAAGAGIVLSTYNTGTQPVVQQQQWQPEAEQLSYTGIIEGAGGVSAADVTNVVEKAIDSVVEISTEYKQVNDFASQYITEGAGSGVILSEDGYIVTNYHVISKASTVKVRTNDGKQYDAELIGGDEQTDLAVLKVEATGLKAAEFADSSSIRVGQVAVAIGNPLGELGGTVTSGIISAKDREISIDGQTMRLLQTSAAVNPGNSGGGLFNADGRLVGIVNAKSSGTDIEGLAFAIPSNTVSEVCKELVKNGYVSGRPQFGIDVVGINDLWAASRYGVREPGVYVTGTETDNGFMVGDLIVSIDGEKITDIAAISKVLSAHKVGDSLSVTVIREGREVNFTAVLREKKPELASIEPVQSAA